MAPGRKLGIKYVVAFRVVQITLRTNLGPTPHSVHRAPGTDWHDRRQAATALVLAYLESAAAAAGSASSMPSERSR